MYRLEVGAIDACTRACVRACVRHSRNKNPVVFNDSKPSLLCVCARARAYMRMCVWAREKRNYLFTMFKMMIL